MPYVHEDIKQRLVSDPPRDAGSLTYEIQQLLQTYLLALGRPYKYEDLATVLASIQGADDDFRRRILHPYEEKKQAENGDVWDPRLLSNSG